jgi:transcriptional regulator with XRE-family HTH domain
VKDRIKKIRKSFSEYGKTQESFAKYLGIPKQNLASYETGRRTPSDAVIQLICEKCNVNNEWLKNGVEPMFNERNNSFTELLLNLEDSDDDFIKSLIKAYMELDKDSKDALRKIAKRMAEEYKGRD